MSCRQSPARDPEGGKNILTNTKVALANVGGKWHGRVNPLDALIGCGYYTRLSTRRALSCHRLQLCIGAVPKNCSTTKRMTPCGLLQSSASL